MCEYVAMKSKRLKTCKRVVKKCGLKCSSTIPAGRLSVWQLVNEGNESDLWTCSVWRKVIGMAVKMYGLQRWKDGMKSKMTLKWYKSKKSPGSEHVYDCSYSSELLFKARSQSLEVNARTYRWNAEGSKECKVCDTRAEESVFHIIVKCVGYEREREVLMHEANVNFGNDFFETWGVDENRGMYQLLGLNESNCRICEVMKIFLVNVWKKRSEYHGRINVQRDVCEHNYARAATMLE